MATYSAAQAAELCQVSIRTIQRKTSALAAAGAWKDATGQWNMTPDMLRAVGLTPGRPAPPDRVDNNRDNNIRDAAAESDTVNQLRVEVADWRRRAEVAEAINTERERTIQTQATALRILDVATNSHAVTAQQPEEPKRRWWNRKGETQHSSQSNPGTVVTSPPASSPPATGRHRDTSDDISS